MKIATFYSFKGGVGRSMAAMNMAWMLTEKGRRVVLIDADLEAPGITMFEDFFNCTGLPKKGIFDYLMAYLTNKKRPRIKSYAHHIKSGPEESELFFIPVANLIKPSDPSDLPWKKLRSKKALENFKAHFCDDLKNSLDPDWVLIDARTGFTELSGLFTVHVADIVVLFTGLNDQNIQGTKWVLDNLRKNKSQAHMIAFSPLPEGEEQLKKERKEKALQLLQGQDLPHVIIPYHPLAALREQIFVRDWPDTTIAKAYRDFKKHLIATNPEDVLTLIKSAQKLLNVDKPEQALALFEPYEKRYIKIEAYLEAYADVIEMNGFKADKSGNYDLALRMFTKLTEIKPWVAKAHYSKGLANYNLRQYREAIDDFAKAIDRDPKIAVAYILRGRSYAALNEHDRAIADDNRAIELDPDNFWAFIGRGDSHSELQQIPKAIEDYSRAIELDPKNAFNIYKRGDGYIKAKQYKKAISDFTRSLKLDPTYTWIYYERGRVYYYLAKYQRAIDDFVTLMGIFPEDAQIHITHAWLLATCPSAKYRDGDKAVKFARKGCELTEWKIPILFDTLAAAYAEAGDFKQAVKWQKKVIAGVKNEAPDEYKKALMARLELYQNRKPYRESPPAP